MFQWREGTVGAVCHSVNMYEEELLYLRSRGMAPAGPLGLHPYLGGGLPANLTDHLEKYRLGFHGKSQAGPWRRLSHTLVVAVVVVSVPPRLSRWALLFTLHSFLTCEKVARLPSAGVECNSGPGVPTGALPPQSPFAHGFSTDYLKPPVHCGGFPAPGLPGGKPDPRIKVRLENENLWNQFNKFGTEMIITKLGR